MGEECEGGSRGRRMHVQWKEGKRGEKREGRRKIIEKQVSS